MDPALGTIKDKEALDELREKFRIIRTVLEQGGGHFSGVNRKVQLKPIRWAKGRELGLASSTSTRGAATSSATAPGSLGGEGGAASDALLSGRNSVAGADLANGAGSTGGAAAGPSLEEALLVVKWGGVLTHAGRKQAENLGTAFRACMYPRHGPAGGGLLRLHSTYRHDLKIYSSDEGRVQTSAAAFTKGLLDLEGNSLTPILVSLVNKDASMLEAYGKGASDEMQRCKAVIYAQLTQDPNKATAASTPVTSTAAATPSPPISPTRVLPPGTVPEAAAAAAAAAGAHHHSVNEPTLAGWDASNAATPTRGPSPAPGVLRGMADPSATHPLPPSPLSMVAVAEALASGVPVPAGTAPPSTATSPPHQGLASTFGGPAGAAAAGAAVAAAGGGSASGAGAGSSTTQVALPDVESHPRLRHLPDNPLGLLRRLVELMRALVDRLHERCLEERPGQGPRAYSSLSQAPEEWELEAGKPCSGERMLLLYDRWRKLYKAFYSEKKKSFDISKIPDIYDSVKHDAIHNAHLGVDLTGLYSAAKALADVVIPHEYGLDPAGKLSIGSKVARELVGKLLADMANMREESLVTMGSCDTGGLGTGLGGGVVGSGDDAVMYVPDSMATEFGRVCLEDERLRSRGGKLCAVTSPVDAGHHLAGTHSVLAQDNAADMTTPERAPREGGDLEEGFDGAGQTPQTEAEAETLHRLCPTYASDINSPLRHVRTRLYFTSESHIHSLVNVLRYCHLISTPGIGVSGSALGLGVAPSGRATAGGEGLAMGARVTSATSLAGSGSLRETLQAEMARGLAAVASGDGALHEAGSASPPPKDLYAAAAAAAQQAAVRDAAAYGAFPSAAPANPILSAEACALLDRTREFDYLTHIVFRMYENKSVPVNAPERFRVEILFSPGTSYNPYEAGEWERDREGGREEPRPARGRTTTRDDSVGPGMPAESPDPALHAHAHTLHGHGVEVGGHRESGSHDVHKHGGLAAAAASEGEPPSAVERKVLALRHSRSRRVSHRTGGGSGGGGGVELAALQGCRGAKWHTLPVVPRVPLHEGPEGVTLEALEDALLPMAKVAKFAPPSYTAQLMARNNPGLQAGALVSRLQSRFGSTANMTGGQDKAMGLCASDMLAAPTPGAGGAARPVMQGGGLGARNSTGAGLSHAHSGTDTPQATD